MDWEVGNVEEAVAQAEEFRRSGSHDWFRGQARPWPPYSSLYRLEIAGDQTAVETARTRMRRYGRWLLDSELRYLVDALDAHSAIAVAQHHGLPTYYLDFSLDPAIAGFFATDTTMSAEPGDLSCIYCLNSEDLADTWSSIKGALGDSERAGAELELVAIDVANLWRLQAQAGVFLYANWNWDVDCPMDRILFPATTDPSAYPRSRVYPDLKSPIEEALDQYFSLSNATDTNESLKSMFAELRSKGQTAMFIDDDGDDRPNGIHEPAFARPTQLRAHPSWSIVPKPAAEGRVENYHDTVGDHIEIELAAEPGNAGRAARSTFAEMLAADPDCRRRAMTFTVVGGPEVLDAESLGSQMATLWNGIRRVAFTSDQLATSMASLVEFVCHGLVGDVSSSQFGSRLESFAGPVLQVGFSVADKSGSRSWVREATLRAALRPDLGELLTPEFAYCRENLQHLLQVCYNARLLFEREPFVDMFAQEAGPLQVVLHRTPALFDPTKIVIFGLP